MLHITYQYIIAAIGRMLAATVVFGRMLAHCICHWLDVVAMADVSWHSCHGLDVGCRSHHRSDVVAIGWMSAATVAIGRM